MLYLRGQRQDYDDWVKAGNPGWGWHDVLPCFIRSEDHVLGASEWHGAGGPLAVTAPTSPNPIAEAFIDAAVACGHRRNPDFNGRTQEGFGLYQVTQKDGARCSSAVAYLDPARDRQNLDIVTGALVGSSAMMRSGPCSMAMAMATRWRMPPESWCG